MSRTTRKNKAAIKLALKHYLRQLRRDWRVSAGALILPGVGAVLTTYAPPLVIAQVLAKFSDGGELTFAEFWPFIMLFAGIWAIGEVIWRLAIHLLNRTDFRGMNRLYKDAMDRLMEKDMGFFNDNFAGSLTKKVVGYAKNYEGFVDTLCFQVLSNIIPLIFVCVVLWSFSPILVFALLLLICLTVVCVVPLIKRRQKLVAKREATSNEAAGHVADIISNMPAVRTFAHEQYESKIHAKNVNRYTKAALKTWDYQNLRVDLVTSPFYVLTNMVGLILAIMVSQQGVVGVETVFVTFSYYASVTRIMWEFNRIYRNLESTVTEAAQYTELLLDPPAINDPVKPDKFTASRGDIAFEKVSFAYPDQLDRPIFKDLSLHIKPGEKIGLVGPSGGGKTSITKILLRLCDVQGGSIVIDGHDIRHISQKDLRRSITYVPQEPMLFHRTIMENIRYGDKNADDKTVKAFAKMAHVEEFVSKMPKGYRTIVGERGVKLSGGQRQRVAIARAMLKSAPIIVLDEATSALDSKSESLIQDALWKLIQRRTAIVIAHRLSTIQRMDRIIVVKNGRIAEQGSHKELILINGAYAKLWYHQTGLSDK